MNLTVIGSGYVGLVSGVCLAELGIDVTCVDKDASKIKQLTAGSPTIYEPGLSELMHSAMQAGRLSFSEDLDGAVKGTDLVMLAVGTPPDPDNEGQANLSYVFAAAKQIAKALSGYTIVITKSTVPVGTNDRIAEIIREVNPNAEFDVASNPEFLREGAAIDDFMKPDRIVVGANSERAGNALAALYRPLTNKGFPLLQTGLRTAEMIKYASNSFLATKIAFINEMADICEHVGADVELVAKGMGMDERIGERFLRPGPGFGGSCFPKDAQALARLAEKTGIHPHIINTVIDYNLGRRDQMARRILGACGGDVSGKTIGILGLTFKANTDDMRESPALAIIPSLLKDGAKIRTYDPEGMDNAKQLLSGNITWCESADEVAQGADALSIVTEWEQFKQLNLQTLRRSMRYPRLIDLRNLYQPATAAAQGFDYYSIGRKPALGAHGEQAVAV